MPDLPLTQAPAKTAKTKNLPGQTAKRKIPKHPARPTKKCPTYPPDSPQAAVIELLTAGPLLADEILRQAVAVTDAGQLNALLLTLEVDGSITRLPGLRYTLS